MIAPRRVLGLGFLIILASVVGSSRSAAAAAPITAGDTAALARAINAARPGDTIVLADGPWRDAAIVFAARGEQGRPITLRCATPGNVVLTGTSRLQIGGQYLVVDGLSFRGGSVRSESVIAFRNDKEPASHCRLTNCAMVDYSPPDIEADTKWVSIYGAFNRVDHCYFAGKTNNGQTLVVWVDDRPNHHTIDFNHFGHRPPLGFNGGETLRVGTSGVSMNVSRTLVENNLFERCDGEVEAISNKSCENIYRHNTFLNCSATLCLRHGNRCLVEGNVFLGNRTRGSGGIRIIGEGHRVVNNYLADLEGDDARAAIALTSGLPNSPLNGYFQVKDVVVAFNTLINNKVSFAIGAGAGKKNTMPPEDCLIADNIVVSTKGRLVEQRAAPIRLKWEGNLIFGADLGIPTPPGVTIADPKLTKGESGLWRPGEGSPARGAAASDLSFVQTDIDGQPRSGPRDVGCDQHSDQPIRYRPLSPEDVGPAWRRTAAASAGRE
jgi:poly(beta-D-mannuronate) lyase